MLSRAQSHITLQACCSVNSPLKLFHSQLQDKGVLTVRVAKLPEAEKSEPKRIEVCSE